MFYQTEYLRVQLLLELGVITEEEAVRRINVLMGKARRHVARLELIARIFPVFIVICLLALAWRLYG